MFPSSTIVDLLIAAGLFAGLVACLEFWFYLGARARLRQAEHLDQLATIQGAMLGLLALLLGFSFALAAGRFSDRVQLISQEANAIGTAWMRCDLLGDVQSKAVRERLILYLSHRITTYDAKADEDLAAAVNQSEALQTEIWSILVMEAKARPEFSEVLLPEFNAMFDLKSTRVAASRRHLPGMLLLLLLLSSAVSIASVGYGCGVAGKRNVVLTTALTFLIAGTLWAIIDMDHPRIGLIRAGQQPMLDLQRSLNHTLSLGPARQAP